MATFEEIPTSREVFFTPPKVTTRWVAEGTFSSDDVATLALTTTPTTALHPAGLLTRADIQVRELGHKLYEVEVDYDETGTLTGNYRMEVGDTKVYLQGRAGKHIQTYTDAQFANYPNHGGLIQVKGNQVEGFERWLPAVKVSLHFQHPAGVVTPALIDAMVDLKYAVTSTPFLVWQAYEVLFLGFESLEGTDVATNATYHFAVRKNATVAIGAITGIDLKGWDIAVENWRPTVVSGQASQMIAGVNVVRIPKERDFATILGFG